MLSRKTTTWLLPTALVVSTALAPTPAVRAQEIDEAKALKVKAAYLYNFAKFIEWPDGAFADEKEPFVIGVLGDDPFGAILDATVKGKTISGHPIRIRRFRWSRAEDRAELTRCDGVYISRSEQFRLDEIFAALRGHPVLTVSDIPGFAGNGGSIGFVLNDGRIRFEMNRRVLARARLKASSKLLKLATIVEVNKHQAVHRR